MQQYVVRCLLVILVLLSGVGLVQAQAASSSITYKVAPSSCQDQVLGSFITVEQTSDGIINDINQVTDLYFGPPGFQEVFLLNDLISISLQYDPLTLALSSFDAFLFNSARNDSRQFFSNRDTVYTSSSGRGAATYAICNRILNVPIDIKPGSLPNSINTKSKGKIPVAILSTEAFSAPEKVDKTSLTFGHSGNEQSLAFCNKGEDVNGDGLLDFVCHFYNQASSFKAGDISGILKGHTVEGVSIIGSDSVNIIGSKTINDDVEDEEDNERRNKDNDDVEEGDDEE